MQKLTHLIPMTEYVKLLIKNRPQPTPSKSFDEIDAEILGKIIRYANFLSEKPTETNCKKYFKDCFKYRQEKTTQWHEQFNAKTFLLVSGHNQIDIKYRNTFEIIVNVDNPRFEFSDEFNIDYKL